MSNLPQAEPITGDIWVTVTSCGDIPRKYLGTTALAMSDGAGGILWP